MLGDAVAAGVGDAVREMGGKGEAGGSGDPLSYGRAPGRFNQMGTSGARALARKLRTRRRGLPEDGHAADEGAIVAGQRERRRLDGPVNAVEAAHREAPIVGAPEAQGADERQIVEGDGRARLVSKGERLRPLGQGHRSDLLEAQPEELLGRLVVEEGIARRIGEEDGQREVARDLAGEDQLDGGLRSGPASLGGRSGHRSHRPLSPENVRNGPSCEEPFRCCPWKITSRTIRTVFCRAARASITPAAPTTLTLTYPCLCNWGSGLTWQQRHPNRPGRESQEFLQA